MSMNFLSHTERKNKEVLDTWLQGNVNGNESQEEIALILKDRNGATDSNVCPRSIVAYDITRKPDAYKQHASNVGGMGRATALCG